MTDGIIHGDRSSDPCDLFLSEPFIPRTSPLSRYVVLYDAARFDLMCQRPYLEPKLTKSAAY
jgi:hypothetical protein